MMPKLFPRKRSARLSALALFVAFSVFSFSSCLKDTCTSTYTYMKQIPVYKTAEELKAPVRSLPAQAMGKPGKIYIYGQYLLVSEHRKGIHIFNNADPSNPQAIGFLNIPGNTDMAVKNNVLYADNYMHLLVLDLSNPANVSTIKIEENVFPGFVREADGRYIVDYDEEEVTETVDCHAPQYRALGMSTRGELIDDVSMQPLSGDFNGGDVNGIGGSMARFTLAGDYLYIVDNMNLRAYNVSSPASPQLSATTIMGSGIETIFPYNNYLFIGTQTGMQIYSTSNPAAPSYAGRLEHVQSCDPVVVENNIAYVTLSGGSRCGGFENQLDVIDVSNPSSTKLLKTYPMSSPKGVGIDKGTLFLCDAIDGLLVYNAADPMSISDHKLGSYAAMGAYDVIPHNNVLILSGEKGIYQYSYDKPDQLQQLSFIPAQ